MIEESLLKSNFIGKDGFVWWIGQVADPSVWRNEKTRIDEGDKAWGYRCKVRIIGYHSFDRNELKDEDLPWAHILTSAADGAPAQGGFGKLPMLIGGESVFGFFLDGEEAQQPVVMSCFYRSPAVINVENPNPFQPFTGAKGNLSKGATRIKRQDDGELKEIPKVTTESGPALTMFSNPQFGTDETGSLDLSPDFNPLSQDNSSFAGSIFGNIKVPQDKLFYDDYAELSFARKFEPITGENGCGNNILTDITSALQSFIKFINGLQQTALGFIDPVRNVIVDIGQSISKVSRLIASLLKSIINGMRDNIFRLIGKLFKILGVTLPSSIQLPISEAAKNILNIIFCLFEKLFGPIMDFIEGLLSGLVGKTPNIPRCAAEETIAALIAKLSSMINGALSTILSGLDWLAGGIGSITSQITNAVNILQQLLSFLDCDSLACKSVSTWDPFGGIEFPSTDNWANTLNNIDILGGLGDNIDETIGFLSMFGSGDTPFAECRETSINPKNQTETPPLPIGVKYYKCVPPEVVINGDGINAKAIPVISGSDGSIMTIKVLNPGKGYTVPPSIAIIDKSNYGKGAIAKSTINQEGEIESIYLIESGNGYCPTNLVGLSGTELTESVSGVSTTPTTLLGTGSSNVGISTIPVGIVTSIVVESPGIGYTSGDTIDIGTCSYEPILTSNGSIIGVTSPNSCKQEFETYPNITINTKTGLGAVLYPVVEYVPRFIADNPELSVGISTFVKVVDCV
jgi:hypothetical protein